MDICAIESVNTWAFNIYLFDYKQHCRCIFIYLTQTIMSVVIPCLDQPLVFPIPCPNEPWTILELLNFNYEYSVAQSFKVFFGANQLQKVTKNKPPREKRHLGTSSNNTHSDSNLPHNTPSGNKAFDIPHLIKTV